MNYPTLDLDESFYPQVLDGTITATIRIGRRPLPYPGRLMFKAANAGYLPLIVNLDLVIQTTWLGITDYDAQLAGYADGDEARDALITLYADMQDVTPDTPFTVIRFSRAA